MNTKLTAKISKSYNSDLSDAEYSVSCSLTLIDTDFMRITFGVAIKSESEMPPYYFITFDDIVKAEDYVNNKFAVIENNNITINNNIVSMEVYEEIKACLVDFFYMSSDVINEIYYDTTNT